MLYLNPVPVQQEFARTCEHYHTSHKVVRRVDQMVVVLIKPDPDDDSMDEWIAIKSERKSEVVSASYCSYLPY